MATGMEIRIIEVQSTKLSTAPLSDSSEEMKESIARDLKERTTGTFELPDIRAFSQKKLTQAFEKRETRIRAQKQEVLGSNLSQGSGNGYQASANLKASATMAAIGLGVDFTLNAAMTGFDIATMGASFGKYGGNQVALRKAENIKKKVQAGKNVASGAIQGAQIGAVFGPWRRSYWCCCRWCFVSCY